MVDVYTGMTIDLEHPGGVGESSMQHVPPVAETRPEPPEKDGWATFNVDRFLVERVVQYHRRYHFATALETGTFRGETTVGLAKSFHRFLQSKPTPKHTGRPASDSRTMQTSKPCSETQQRCLATYCHRSSTRCSHSSTPTGMTIARFATSCHNSSR